MFGHTLGTLGAARDHTRAAACQASTLSTLLWFCSPPADCKQEVTRNTFIRGDRDLYVEMAIIGGRKKRHRGQGVCLEWGWLEFNPRHPSEFSGTDPGVRPEQC